VSNCCDGKLGQPAWFLYKSLSGSLKFCLFLKTRYQSSVLIVSISAMKAFLVTLLSVVPTLAAPFFEVRGAEYSWAAIGDSFAAGVAYKDEVQYDANKDECERTNEAYASQMQDDNSWTNDPQAPHFAACSGALLVNMVAQEQHPGQGPQISNVGTPNIMTMHAGGNNVGFGDVARNCIFQSPLESYGAAYPDAAGKCKQAVDAANGRINDRGETSGLLYDTKRTIQDILDHDNFKDRPDFRLYVLGYIHFFNVDSPDSDWCNTVTFAPAGSYLGKQVLTNQLRTDINDAVERVNRVMQEAAGSFDNRVGYIDLSAAYNGYRFCEKGATYNEQWLVPVSSFNIIIESNTYKVRQECLAMESEPS
jgi:hypothetical protein